MPYSTMLAHKKLYVPCHQRVAHIRRSVVIDAPTAPLPYLGTTIKLSALCQGDQLIIHYLHNKKYDGCGCWSEQKLF